MHLGLASVSDAQVPADWSGTPYFMGRALQARVAQFSYLCPIVPGAVLTHRRISKLKARFLGGSILPHATRFAARHNARELGRLLAGRKVDAIFAPAGSSLIGELETDLPIIYSSDATVKLMTDYYREWTGLSRQALREADALERAAIRKSDLLIYPSQWAARSAIEDYGAEPARVAVAAYGANMHDVPDRARALAPRRADRLELLFVGVDWARKGGDIAVAALAALRAMGLEARLTVVGCVPPPRVPRDHLAIHPFLSKNDPAQAAQLSRLYLAADLLVVPTRAECFGVVWCEAAAHGVPSIATATGGVPDVVTEGVTGHTLPPAADGAAYAALIAEIARDRDRLAALRRSARQDYEARLNWGVWADRVVQLARDRLASRAAE